VNLLTVLNYVLSFEGREQLRVTHQKILEDAFVIKEGLIPSLDQVRRFFELMRLGLIYTRATYGNEATPEKMEIYSWSERPPDGHKDPFFIAYYGGVGTRVDHVVITRLYIARHCVHFDDGTITSNDHLPPGYGVSAVNHVVISMIEEFYHRFQVHAQGKTPRDTITHTTIDRTDPIELGIIPVLKRAVNDLNIQLYLKKGVAHESN